MCLSMCFQRGLLMDRIRNFIFFSFFLLCFFDNHFIFFATAKPNHVTKMATGHEAFECGVIEVEFLDTKKVELIYILDFPGEDLSAEQKKGLVKKITSNIKGQSLSIEFIEDPDKKEKISAKVYVKKDGKLNNILTTALDEAIFNIPWYLKILSKLSDFVTNQLFVGVCVVVLLAFIVSLFVKNIVERITVTILTHIEKSAISNGIVETFAKELSIAIQDGVKDALGRMGDHLGPLAREIVNKHWEKMQREIHPVASPGALISEPTMVIESGKEFEEAISLFEKEAQKHHEERNYEIIKKTCDELNKNHPNNQNANLWLVKYFYLPQSDYDSAQRILNRLKEVSPSAMVFYYLSVIEEDRGRYKEAKRYIKGALEMDEDKPIYHTKIAYLNWFVWEEAGREDLNLIQEAVKHSEIAQRLMPKELEAAPDDYYIELKNAWLFYLCLLEDEESLSVAAMIVEYFENTINLSDFERRAYCWDTLGFFYEILYKLRFKIEKDETSTSLKIIRIDQFDNNLINTSIEYYKKALKEESLDIKHDMETNKKYGKDIDIWERYQNALAIKSSIELNFI